MRTYKPTGRRRGAPAGNTNALKHGIYSRHISTAEQTDIESMSSDKNADELATRVVMASFRDNHRVLDNDSARAVESLERAGVSDFESYREHVSGRVTRRAYETGDCSTGMIDLGPAAVFARKIKPAEAIIDAIGILGRHPHIGRPVRGRLRELVISYGRTGYVALYRVIPQQDRVDVLAIRHQREAGYQS